MYDACARRLVLYPFGADRQFLYDEAVLVRRAERQLSHKRDIQKQKTTVRLSHRRRYGDNFLGNLAGFLVFERKGVLGISDCAVFLHCGICNVLYGRLARPQKTAEIHQKSGQMLAFRYVRRNGDRYRRACNRHGKDRGLVFQISDILCVSARISVDFYHFDVVYQRF